MKEEAGITVTDIVQHGVLDFRFAEDESEVLEVHIFKATRYTGSIKETDEMRPKWFSLSDIPYKDMWPDDQFWVPLFLEGKCFVGAFLFGPNDTVLENTLQTTVCEKLD
jgi:hypothetical protein